MERLSGYDPALFDLARTLASESANDYPDGPIFWNELARRRKRWRRDGDAAPCTRLPGVRSGMLLFPFSEAKAVLEGCVDITASAAEELTVQLGLVGGPDGAAAVMVVPTWSGLPQHGEALVAPFFQLGTLHAEYFDARGCRRLLSGGAGKGACRRKPIATAGGAIAETG
jgi:hypothetical protein